MGQYTEVLKWITAPGVNIPELVDYIDSIESFGSTSKDWSLSEKSFGDGFGILTDENAEFLGTKTSGAPINAVRGGDVIIIYQKQDLNEGEVVVSKLNPVAILIAQGSSRPKEVKFTVASLYDYSEIQEAGNFYSYRIYRPLSNRETAGYSISVDANLSPPAEGVEALVRPAGNSKDVVLNYFNINANQIGFQIEAYNVKVSQLNGVIVDGQKLNALTVFEVYGN